jgi:hypothetical protein
MKFLILAAALIVPTPSTPPDDPGFDRCLRPWDAVDLEWTPQPEPGIATWLIIKRRNELGEWRPWISTYVRGSRFSLNMQNRLARSADFAWILFAVDRAGGEYLVGEWRYFCTRE